MYDGFCITCEVLHFFDGKIQDTSLTGFKRRDLAVEGLRIENEAHDFVRRVFEDSHALLNHDSRIFRSVKYYLDRQADVEQTTRRYVETPEYERPATVAEAFDLTILKKFSQMPALGMMARLLKEAERSGHDHKAKSLRGEVRSRLEPLNNEITRASVPKTIPIRTLVRIQLQSALVCLRYLDSASRS